MKQLANHRIALPALLILFGSAARIFPHPANFAPIGAIAIFAGMYLPKRWNLLVPAASMLIADMFIGFYRWEIMLAVYGSFLASIMIGASIRRRKQLYTIVAGTLASSILFFLVTNAAVWAFGTLYDKTFAGLMESYAMAIPFFRNTLLSDIFYTGILAGAYEFFAYLARQKRPLATAEEPG